MKVFNKGQVVIPAQIRRMMEIAVGDMLDVTVDKERDRIELTKHEVLQAEELAGSLSRYRKGKEFPSRRGMQVALEKGLRREG